MSKAERSRWRFMIPVVAMFVGAGWNSAISNQHLAGSRAYPGLNDRKQSVSPSVIRNPQSEFDSTELLAGRNSQCSVLRPPSSALSPQSSGKEAAGSGLQAPGAPPETRSPKPEAFHAEVEAVLDRLEKADAELKDLRAKVRYSVLQLIKANKDDPDDVQHYVGSIRFLKQPEPTQFFIHFEKRSRDNKWVNEAKQWFIFDGEWLTTAKENGKTVEREQIVRPGAKSEFYKLGQGPFPLPFGQKKADVLEHFYVQLAPPSKNDPKSTDHLICTTKPDSSMANQFERIDLFVSNDEKSGLSGLSIKIIVENVKDQTRETITFSEIRRNKGLQRDKDFALPSFTKKWQKSERPLPSGS